MWTTDNYWKTTKEIKWSNIHQIEKLINLKHLNISEIPVADLSPIEKLKQLEILELVNLLPYIEKQQTFLDVKPKLEFIKHLTNLHTLRLEGFGPFDITQLGSHPKVKKLIISHNLKIYNLSQLPELFPNLEELSLHSLEIDSLQPLLQLKKLKYLDLTFATIHDSSALNKFENVKINLACSNLQPCG